MKDHFKKQLEPYMVEPMLQLGCALNKEEGFWTLDKDPNVEPDSIHDLVYTPLPIEDEAFNFILATHVLEHLRFDDVLPLMVELHRVLKPGGHLFIAVPHGGSDDAWENPHHRSYWSANTFSYFTPELYKVEGTPGYGSNEGCEYAPWVIVRIDLVTYDDLKRRVERDTAEFSRKARFRRNMFREVQALMKKKKGVQ